MKLLFELSREHDSLPYDEVLSTLGAEKIKFRCIEKTNNVVVLDTNIKDIYKVYKIGKRLSLSYFINEYFFSCGTSIKDIQQNMLSHKIDEKGSIAIHYKNRSKKINSKKILDIVAKFYSENRLVDLKNPKITIRILIEDEKIFIGKKLIEINRSEFEKRKAHYRPYFSPISMHPKIARALVNLSLIKKNDVLLDPFCGTGGILIEAGLIGAKIIGSDIEKKMIDGCKKNLDFYNIKDYQLFCCDISKIKNFVNSVDTIVTDLPYGTSTTTKGEKIISLYDRSFKIMNEILKDGGHLVIGISNENILSLLDKYFSMTKVHRYRVHRSLTRFFAILSK